MSNVKVKFYNILKVVGYDEMKVLVLVSEDEQFQLSIPLDEPTLQQFALRLQRDTAGKPRLAETLWEVITAHHKLALENYKDIFQLEINEQIQREYRAHLVCLTDGSRYPLLATDAVLLSLITGLPLYVEERLWMNQRTEYIPGEGELRPMRMRIETFSEEMLRKDLSHAIEREDYESASLFRDELKRRGLTP